MEKQPNFLLIMTDQHRADHLGCYGNTIVQTPNIDRIAAKGTSHDRFYVATPVCQPNRASLATGRMPSAHGVRHNGISLSSKATTFIDILRAAGYRTGLVGKAHLQNFMDSKPAARRIGKEGYHPVPEALSHAFHDPIHGPGFTTELVPEWLADPAREIDLPYYGFDHLRLVSASRGGHYRKWLSEQSPDALELLAPENALPDNRYVAPQAWRTSLPEELYPTGYIGHECAEFLRRHAAEGGERPFFLQCSFPDPHHPFTPPGKYWDMYDPADIPLPPSFGDDVLARLPDIPELREPFNTEHSRGAYPYRVNEREIRESIALTYGMISMVDDQVGRLLALLSELDLERDTVVIFTSDHGDYMGDHGLMLKLSLHYQGVLRVPFIWHDPASPGGGARSDGMAGTVDIARTILDRARLQPYFGIQGISLLDDSESHQGMLIEDYSVMYYFQPDGPNQMLTYVEPDWRLSVIQATPWGELYDLAGDPHEMHNLWDDPAAAPVRARLMEAMIREMMACRDHTYSPTSAA